MPHAPGAVATRRPLRTPRAARALRTAALLVATAPVAAACSTPADDGPDPARPGAPATASAPSSPTPPPPPPPAVDATVTPLSDRQWNRMVAVGMWRKGCPVGRKELRRVEMNHWDFNGELRRGELIVNADTAPSIVRVFGELFEQRFPIRRMESVEAYEGDLDASLKADNTSAFNCRRPDQINAPFMESPHANGRAVDINPRENPWQDLRKKAWSPGPEFSARTPGKGKILEGGPVWRAFTAEGWIWQNISVADYMHFDTGYPSVPFRPKAGKTTPGPGGG
ncbi:M15 family metallopeptidase [Streptomyces qinzhouensis]|uniref:M15 family metallopeptidase n=1 Tax=Streptomyces qinzhouensis TaxID=2599401 RepID=A0A5B8ILI9_9ACTN|nr:M15 family metallopeptidase [Streptomyces qinzhouensis]QDY79422.1 M15 family metallopeptidase [Streptomyces qinzhouensis]